MNFNAQLNGQPNSITFIDDVTYNFDYKEPESKVSVSKNGTYDANSGLITYTVDVLSTGANTDVTVTDSISGTALVYQKDVSGMSNKSGALSVAASNTDSGFTYWENSGFEIDTENGVSGTASFKCEGALDTTKSLAQTVTPANRDSYTISCQIASDDLKVGENGQVGIEVTIEYEDGTTETRFVDLL